jgi:UDP-N-acetylmuramoyl-L-alanyl-D-glutamate--2,6-diaminopimelate ligase
MSKTLAELLSALPQTYHLTGDPNTIITAPVVESDSDLQPGGVFVARKGQIVDGHDFIPRANERGAAAIVGERLIDHLPVPYVQVENPQEAAGYLAAAYHDFPSRKLIVIGVTGTDGKTTTSTLIHSILQVATGGKAGMISTIAAHVGDKTVETGLHVTTPGAPQVQALLAQMVANGLTHAVIEMTSIGLAQGRVNGVDIDVAVLTNVTHEHLNDHGSFEAYRAAKGRMFEMLSTSYRKLNQPKVSVINADDPNAEFFAAFPADKVVRYGVHHNANLQAVHIDLTYGMPRFEVVDSLQDTNSFLLPLHYLARHYNVWLSGEFNVYNGLAAVAVSTAK